MIDPYAMYRCVTWWGQFGVDVPSFGGLRKLPAWKERFVYATSMERLRVFGGYTGRV